MYANSIERMPKFLWVSLARINQIGIVKNVKGNDALQKTKTTNHKTS